MDKPISPGEAIATRLAARGWTQSRLARESGLHVAIVSHICKDYIAPTDKYRENPLRMAEAQGLVKAFPDTSVAYWLNLQKQWQLYKLLQERKGATWK